MSDWLASAARRHPRRVFLLTPDGSYAFAEVDTRVRRAVGGLRRAGVGADEPVAVWAGNDLESVVSLFAVPRSGGVTVLLNTRLTAGEAARQVARAGARLVVGPTATPELGIARIDPADLDGPAESGVEPVPERLHSIVFTSGSSGIPKGVRLTWGNLEASAGASAAHLGDERNDRWLAVLPLFHVGGFSILVRAARQAIGVVLEPRFDPDRVGAILGSGGATLTSLVAVMLARLLDVASGPFPALRAVLLGGGPVHPALRARAIAAGLPVLPTYGLTETASQVATARPGDPLLRPVALPGAELGVDAGRIMVRGPMVSPGYLGEPDRAPGDWLDTGDLGELDGEGHLRVLGRSDDVLVCGGENVMPPEVEEVLLTHPGVVEAVVVGVPDPVWGAIPAAAYVGSADAVELERHVRARLAGYKVPRRWVRLEAVPRISIGKVDREAVRRALSG